jgi:hypothetical protein
MTCKDVLSALWTSTFYLVLVQLFDISIAHARSLIRTVRRRSRSSRFILQAREKVDRDVTRAIAYQDHQVTPKPIMIGQVKTLVEE